VKFQADSQGQSVSEYTRRALRGRLGAEASPYRFTGFTGPSFISDLSLVQGWSSGESAEIDEAMERPWRSEKWSEDAVRFAAQSTTTASQIVPPGYRTAVSIAMTIDRPLASACETLPISGSAPFNVPRAGGDGTVQAARAEGSNPAGSDPTFGSVAITPVGLAGKIDLTRELVDSASPGGDLIALSVLKEDWYRQAEARIYNALNTAQGGTITGDFAANGAQAVSDATPTTTLHTTLKKRLLDYAVLRRRKPRNVVAGRAALDNLAGLLTAEDATGDDTCMARIFGARVNASTNDFATGSTEMRVAILEGTTWSTSSLRSRPSASMSRAVPRW
jgi:hypothetical protein